MFRKSFGQYFSFAFMDVYTLLKIIIICELIYFLAWIVSARIWLEATTQVNIIVNKKIHTQWDMWEASLKITIKCIIFLYKSNRMPVCLSVCLCLKNFI